MKPTHLRQDVIVPDLSVHRDSGGVHGVVGTLRGDGAIQDTGHAVEIGTHRSLKDRYATPTRPTRKLKTWTKAERDQEKAAWQGQPGPGARDSWGKSYSWVTHAGLLKTLTRAELLLKEVLCQSVTTVPQPSLGLEPGECCPSILTLAQWTGLNRTSVIRGLKALAKKGIIKPPRKGRGWNGHARNIYRIVERG